VEITDLTSNSTALSTSYEGDADVVLFGFKDKTEEGYTFHKEKYLKNISDRKINNYSGLYLTNKQKLSDVLEVKQLSDVSGDLSFNTSISDTNNLYLTFSASDSGVSSYYFTAKNQRFVDPVDSIFEITLLTDGLRALVSHRSKNRINYFLNLENNIFKFSTVSGAEESLFNYILDKENGKLSLFKNSNLVTTSSGSLILDPIIENFKTKHFNVNYYIQKISPKLNTSWVSYDPTHKNAYDILPDKSINNLENNLLISTQYSYITGDTLVANILNLKNQKTHKDYSYRSNFLEKTDDGIPNVDNRKYVRLFTGNDQETGDYGITLSYEFYNADYKFETDKYTIFISPESLYPYERININDLKWNKAGSIAGENPYMSDKIFQKKENMGGLSGSYLCSWLHKDKNGESTWLDRYYYPEKTTYAVALSTSFNFNYVDPIYTLLQKKLSASEYYDVPFVYNTLEEERIHTPQNGHDALYGTAFFDKRSDLTILPNTEYIYHRIGNKYVDSIVSSIEESLIQKGLILKNHNNAEIDYNTEDTNEIEYVLDGNAYAMFSDYEDINNSHQFTITFDIKSDNWSEKFGHQIFGNLNDKGIGLFDDEKITPLIMIQNNKTVSIYNTNFEMLDYASLVNEENLGNSVIKDLYRTDHLDVYYTINVETNDIIVDPSEPSPPIIDIPFDRPITDPPFDRPIVDPTVPFDRPISDPTVIFDRPIFDPLIP
jgi:hypothetical protein